MINVDLREDELTMLVKAMVDQLREMARSHAAPGELKEYNAKIDELEATLK